MNTFSRSLVLFVAAAVLASCGSTNTSSVPRLSAFLEEQTKQDGRACVREFEIRGYGVRHRNLITIDAGRKYYVATVFSQCPILETSFQAAFVSRFPEICGGSSRVITRDERCFIQNIFEFDNREAANEAIEQAFNSRQDARAEAKNARLN